MKIKGSVKNLKMKTAGGVGATGAIIALAIRIYQYLSGLVDFETGFYTRDDFTTYLLYGVLAVTAVAVFAICLLAGEAPRDKLPSKKNYGLVAISVSFIAGLALDAMDKFDAFNRASALYNPYLYDGQPKITYLMKSGALPTLLEGVFAAISIVFIVLFAVKFAGVKIDLRKFRFFSLCPLFWATCRMVQRFTKTISFMNVSKLFLELFMIAFMMMFFMYFAQLTSQVNSRGNSYKVVAYGIIAGMFALVVAIPELMVIFSEEYKTLSLMGKVGYPLEYVDIVFVGFAFFFADFYVSGSKVKNMTYKETEKIIEEEK